MIPGIATGFGTDLSALTSKLTSSPATKADTSATGSFGDAFKSAVNQVDQLQAGADTQIGSMLHGSGTADVGGVMASVEKADVAFQLMMQVRNKIVSAYQDIEKMQF